MDWDLADLERDSEPSISSVVGGQKSREDCSVDLKLGRVDDFADRSLSNIMACATVSSSGPSKRARGINNSSQIIFCLVDGCKSNLSNCRDYHKRHKVCEVHAKTPKVIVGGQEQRFCQQCSRFHSLVEFDEVKRSCRKRLDGHNRRRRKRQPSSLSGTSNTFFPNYQGGTFSSCPQMLSPTPSNPTWAQPIKFEEDTLHARQAPLHYLDRQHLFPVLSARNYKTSKNFALRGTSNAIPSTSQPLSNTLTSSNSDCALSLLSLPNEPSGLNLSQMVQDDVTPMAHPFLSGLHFSINNNHGLDHYSCSQASNDVSSCSVMEDKQMATPDLVSDGGDTNFHGFFHLGEGDSSRPVENEVSETVPIFWLS